MTTIVFDPVNKVLASDSRTTWDEGGTLRYFDGTQKVFKLEGGYVAFAGEPSHSLLALNNICAMFAEKHTVHELPTPEFLMQQTDVWKSAVVESSNGICCMVFQRGDEVDGPIVHELHASGGFIRNYGFCGVGSGCQFALGVLGSGGTIEAAMEAAALFDLKTSPDFTTYEL